MNSILPIRWDVCPVVLDPLVEILRKMPEDEGSAAFLEAHTAASELNSVTTDADPHDLAVRLLAACQGSATAAVAAITHCGYTPESRRRAIDLFHDRLVA